MPDAPNQPLNLVLKRREEEQGGLGSFDLIRVSSDYATLVRRGLGQICIIYVPSRGSNGIHPERHHVARAVLADIAADPGDGSLLLLRLDDLRFFSTPLPFQYNGFVFETGEQYARRNYSREQKDIRGITHPNLQRILQMGSQPAGTIDLATDISPPLIQRNSSSLPEGLAESGVNESRRTNSERARYHSSPLRRELYVRLMSMRLDNATCAVTGFRGEFDGKPVGVSVAHIQGLGYHGEDWLTNTMVMAHLAHDLWDRFAFTFCDDLQILWSKHSARLPHQLQSHSDGFARVSRPAKFMPDLNNIRWHRAEFLRREALRDANVAGRINGFDRGQGPASQPPANDAHT